MDEVCKNTEYNNVGGSPRGSGQHTGWGTVGIIHRKRIYEILGKTIVWLYNLTSLYWFWSDTLSDFKFHDIDLNAQLN